MFLSVLFSCVLAAAPASDAAPSRPLPQAAHAAKPTSGAPKAASPLAPEVQKAVDAMQRFYEGTEHFEADFVQTYTYTTFARQTTSKGHLRFLKSGSAMRWDYTSPNEKSFIVAASRYFVYDKAAKQIMVAEMDSDRISASLSFLWGQGRITDAFNVAPADRDDLGDGIGLELTPKTPDPRFQKIYFLLSRENYSVKGTLVVDPDGSENLMEFSNIRTDGTYGKEVFRLSPPPDVQVLRFDRPDDGKK